MILKGNTNCNSSFFSQIAFAFLLSVLIKKSVLTGVVGFLFIVFWGCLGYTTLFRQLPSSLEWVLGLFSPFAFTTGMTQVRTQWFHDFIYKVFKIIEEFSASWSLMTNHSVVEEILLLKSWINKILIKVMKQINQL